jgi:hypothetical protein
MIITPPRRLCESLLDRQRGVTNVNMHPCKTLFVYVKYKYIGTLYNVHTK